MLPGPLNKTCLACHATQADLDRQIRDGTTLRKRPTRQDRGPTVPAFTPPAERSGVFSPQSPGSLSARHAIRRTEPPRDANLGPANSGKRISTRDPPFRIRVVRKLPRKPGRDNDPEFAGHQPAVRREQPFVPPRQGSHEGELSLRGSDMTERRSTAHIVTGTATPRPKRLHGSAVRYLLRSAYTTVDGQATNQSPTYRLCYECHDRELVIDSTRLPRTPAAHRRSTGVLRHLPQPAWFGGEPGLDPVRRGRRTTSPASVPPCPPACWRSSRQIPGEGTCYLTCHGVDHGPEVYGGGPAAFELPGSTPRIGPDGNGLSAIDRAARKETRLAPRTRLSASSPPRAFAFSRRVR